MLMEVILELLSFVCRQANDLTAADQDAKFFDIWTFLLYFHFKFGLFSQKSSRNLLESFLTLTGSFHAINLLPKKRSLIFGYIQEGTSLYDKFLNYLKDFSKFILDDPKGYIIVTYEAEELLLLTLAYTTQSLKFWYGLDNDLSSYLYTYYIKSTPTISFETIFKVFQKVLFYFIMQYINHLLYRH